MIIRLIGDGSSYMTMMKQAASSTLQAGQVIQQATDHIERMGKQVEGFASSAAQALASFGAAAFLHRAMDLFTATETTLLKLKAAIEATGQAVEPTLARFQDFAKAMFESTGTSKDQTLHLLQMASNYGLTGDAAMRATKAAIALSASQGGSAEHFLMVGKAIEEGNAHMIHHVQALRGITDPQQKLAKAAEMVASGMKVAEAQMDSTAGVMKRFSTVMTSLTKQFGEVVAEGVKPVVKWLTELVKNFTDLDPSIKRLVVAGAGLVTALLALGPALRITLFTLSSLGLLFSPITLSVAALSFAVYKLVEATGSLGEAWRVVVEWVGQFAAQNKTLLVALGATAVTLGAVYVAWQLLSTLGVVFVARMAIGLTIWVAWKTAALAWQVATLAAAAAVWLWNAAATAMVALAMSLTFLANFGTVSWAAYGVVVGVVKAVMWLATAAAAAFNLALAALPVAALAGVVAVGALATGIAGLVALVSGIGAAFGALAGVFAQFTTAAGPLQEVGDMLGGWWQTLKNVVQVAKVDMVAAWEILKAGAALAVAQVKALWPPLWTFIKDGFMAVWGLVSAQFSASMDKAFVNTGAKMVKWLDIFGLQTKANAAYVKQINEMANNEMAESADKAATKFTELLAKFKSGTASMADSEELKRLAANLAQATQAGMDKLATGKVKALDLGTTTGAAIGDGMAKGLHAHMPHMDAVLSGTAEAQRRITAFQDAMKYGGGHDAGHGQAAAASATTKVVNEVDQARAAMQEANRKLLDAWVTGAGDDVKGKLATVAAEWQAKVDALEDKIKASKGGAAGGVDKAKQAAQDAAHARELAMAKNAVDKAKLEFDMASGVAGETKIAAAGEQGFGDKHIAAVQAGLDAVTAQSAVDAAQKVLDRLTAQVTRDNTIANDLKGLAELQKPGLDTAKKEVEAAEQKAAASKKALDDMLKTGDANQTQIDVATAAANADATARDQAVQKAGKLKQQYEDIAKLIEAQGGAAAVAGAAQQKVGRSEEAVFAADKWANEALTRLNNATAKGLPADEIKVLQAKLDEANALAKKAQETLDADSAEARKAADLAKKLVEAATQGHSIFTHDHHVEASVMRLDASVNAMADQLFGRPTLDQDTVLQMIQQVSTVMLSKLEDLEKIDQKAFNDGDQDLAAKILAGTATLMDAMTPIKQGATPGSFYTHDTHVEAAVLRLDSCVSAMAAKLFDQAMDGENGPTQAFAANTIQTVSTAMIGMSATNLATGLRPMVLGVRQAEQQIQPEETSFGATSQVLGGSPTGNGKGPTDVVGLLTEIRDLLAVQGKDKPSAISLLIADLEGGNS